MGIMPQNFFPSMYKPYFSADCVFPEGYSIRETENDLNKVEEWLVKQPEVIRVSATYGGSPLRYYLASTSFGPKANFGNLLIELHDKSQTIEMEAKLDKYVRENYPNIMVRSSLFKLSPATEATIEIGFIGNSVDTLVNLTEKAMAVMRNTGLVIDIRNSWGNKVPVWQPEYSQERGQRLGITRQTVAYSLKVAPTGMTMGEFREGDLFMPILLKQDGLEEGIVDTIRMLPVFSPSGFTVPLTQVVDRVGLK